MNFAGGIYGRALNEIVEGHAHGEELGENGVKTENRVVPRVQVRGNGIGNETLLDRGDGIAEPEAPRAVANIENHAPLAGFEQNGIQLSIGKNDGELLSKDVRVNIAGTRFSKDKIS